MSKISLLILCGGKSGEHSISLVSTWNLLNLLDRSLFEPTLIAIDKKGNWWLQEVSEFQSQEPNPLTISIPSKTRKVLVCPGDNEEKFFLINQKKFLEHIDVVFPLLHGPNGEDGSIQGLLEHLQMPYIGPGVLGSAVCMDKDVAKRLMLQAGIPTSKFVTLFKADLSPDYEKIKKELGLPMFVKPANLGSSVGINKVRNQDEFEAAIQEAFQYDKKVIVEEFIDGQEVECAVLGNFYTKISDPGTYVHNDDFFDFDTKYLKADGITMQIPAAGLTKEQIEEVKHLSILAYGALECEGLARVDTFVTSEGKFLVNEINTLPGFTQNSMYPVLMEKTGYPYNKLIQELVHLAIERSDS